MFEFTIGNIKTFTPWEQPRFDTLEVGGMVQQRC